MSVPLDCVVTAVIIQLGHSAVPVPPVWNLLPEEDRVEVNTICILSVENTTKQLKKFI